MVWNIGAWDRETTLQLSDLVKVEKNAIGVTSTDGMVLTNLTPAAAGAQQISPRTRWTGQGWKTNATAGSQTVDYIAQMVPVQGAANPQARLDFNYQINGGGFQATPTLSLLDNFVGIGTISPGSALEVVGKVAINGGNVNWGDFNAATLGIFEDSATDALIGFRRQGNAYWSVGTLALDFSISSNSVNNILFLSNGGNIGFGTTSLGTSAVKTVAFGAGTAPTTSPADVTQFWTADWNGALTNALFIRTEEGTQHVFGSKVGIGLVSPGSILEIGTGGSLATTRTTLEFNEGGYSNTPSAANAYSDGDKIRFWADASGKAAIGMGSNYNLWFQSNGAAGSGIEFWTGSGTTATKRTTVKSDGNVVIGTETSPTVATRVAIFDSTQLAARIGLTGQEYYQAANTSTDGLAIVLGVNRAANRQLWIGDTAALAQNTTNTVMRFMVGGTGMPTVDAVATDGTTTKVFALGNASGIQYGKALVALGGGAAPTLGTIGGSGPTVAGQNAWMQMKDSTGADVWVPAWK